MTSRLAFKRWSTSDSGRHAWMIAVLGALTLAFYWRVTRDFTNLIASDGADGAMFTWDIWYFPHALSEGHNPFFTNDLFFPIGARLGFHTYVPLLGAIAWPITAVFGLPIAVNTIAITGPFFTGVATYFLAHHITKHRWAALVVGAAMVVWPDQAFRMSANINFSHLEFIPLALLAQLKLYETRSSRHAIFLGVAAGLATLIDFTQLVFIVMVALIVAIAHWRTTFSRLGLVRLLQSSITAAIVSSPVLITAFREVRDNELDPIKEWGGANLTSADVLSYVTPSPFHPWWGHRFQNVWTEATSGERFTYMTLTLLLIGFFGILISRFRDKPALVGVGAVFFVLSFGPFLHIYGATGGVFHHFGTPFSIPLPYAGFHLLPVLQGVRIPSRFSIVVAIVLAVFAASAIATVCRRLPTRLTPIIAIACVSLMWIESMSTSFPVMTQKKVPAPYEVIRNDPGNLAVLELPMQWRDGFGQVGDDVLRRDNTIFMYYATTHQKPIVGGMVARLSQTRKDALISDPLLHQVLNLQGDGGTPLPITFRATDLSAKGIGYVVMHDDKPLPQARRYIEALNMKVLAQSDGVTVWKV